MLAIQDVKYLVAHSFYPEALVNDVPGLASKSRNSQSVRASLAINKVHLLCCRWDPFSDAGRTFFDEDDSKIWLCVIHKSGSKEGSLISSIGATTKVERINDCKASA